MKLDENEELLTPELIEIHAQAQIKKQLKRLGSMKVYPGQKIFKISYKTQEITFATYEEDETSKVLIMDGADPLNVAKAKNPNKKIIIEPGFHYVPAQTTKAALKVFVKDMLEERKNRQEQKKKSDKFITENTKMVVRSNVTELELILKQEGDLREFIKNRIIALQTLL